MTAVVEASGLGKVHGRGEAAVTALQEVDLTVSPGEFVAVTGPSGCGAPRSASSSSSST